MSSHTVLKSFAIPENFVKIFNDSLIMLDNDEEFKDILEAKRTQSGNKDKRYDKNKQNKLEGLKVRFMIARYYKDRKLKLLEGVKHATA